MGYWSAGRASRRRTGASTTCSRASLAGDLGGVDGQVGVRGDVVRVTDAGELGDQPGPGLGVEALEVAPLALLQRGGDVDQDEVADRLDHRAHRGPALGVRRDGRADREPTVPGDLTADEADPPDVEIPCGAVEPEPGGQQPAYVVAVEQADRARACAPRCTPARSRASVDLPEPEKPVNRIIAPRRLGGGRQRPQLGQDGGCATRREVVAGLEGGQQVGPVRAAGEQLGRRRAGTPRRGSPPAPASDAGSRQSIGTATARSAEPRPPAEDRAHQGDGRQAVGRRAFDRHQDQDLAVQRRAAGRRRRAAAGAR